MPLQSASAQANLSISVLVATYGGENSRHLNAALQSVFAQTEPAEECVLVVDGPIDAAQEAVIQRFSRHDGPTRLVVERLARRMGQAAAWNAGLRRCRGDLIARMDSDDICIPERFSLQRRVFAETPDIDLVCGWSTEFENDLERPIYVKQTPESHADIVAALKRRWCITHPTVMVRRAAIERIGGYRSCFGTLADCDLYVRLIMAGARFHALQQPLLLFRVSPAQRARRGGLRLAIQELELRRYCLSVGYLSKREFLRSAPSLVGFRLLPAQIRGYLYRFARARTDTV